MFFFFLLGACVANLSLSGLRSLVPIVNSNVYPVNKFGSSFNLIQTAKTNPRALIKLLEGADEGTLIQIIKLLNQLRDEGIAEHERITGILKRANLKLAAALKLYADLQKKEGEAKIVLAEATKTFNEAEGALAETKREHDAEAPGLKKEIEIFQKVLDILNGLLNGQPQEKSLLELGMDAEAQTYQRLIENAKADPGKLKKVIALINKLLTQSETDLAALETAVQTATTIRDVAEKAKVAADGKHVAAAAAVGAQSAVVSEVKGEKKEAQQQYDTRIPVLEAENQTLDEVIGLLKKMLAEQQKQ